MSKWQQSCGFGMDQDQEEYFVPFIYKVHGLTYLTAKKLQTARNK